MELILKETIDSLGREGDIVSVKPGYARNYLLPQGKAVLANAANRALLEQNRAEIQARIDAEQKEAEKLLKKLSGISLEFQELAGEDDKLFGSVTLGDVYQRLLDKGIEVEKKNIFLNEAIKTLGEQTVTVKAGFDLETEIIIRVVAQGSETTESTS